MKYKIFYEGKFYHFPTAEAAAEWRPPRPLIRRGFVPHDTKGKVLQQELISYYVDPSSSLDPVPVMWEARG